jgi:outer membrane protein OmpA-like peptidoglycan-associated protein
MKNISIWTGILAAAALCGSASAQETKYAAGAQALPLQQEGGTARAMGMGSAVVAVKQDSASLLWNPAGLGYMSSKEIGLHHNSGLGDTIQEIAVFGMPLGHVEDEKHGGSMGGIAVSLGYVNYGTFSGANEAGVPGANYSAGDVDGSIGWGKELIPNLSAGIALKGNHSRFAGQGYSNAAADLGLLLTVDKMNFGLTYNNLKVAGYSAGATLASGLRLGAGWDFDKHWLWAASGELQYKGMKRAQFGTEYLIGDVDEGTNILALRGGYQLDFPSAELGFANGLSMGIGYKVNRFVQVDYALLPAGDLGRSHRLSLTIKFGDSRSKDHASAAPAPVPVARLATPVAAAAVVNTVVLEDSHFDFDSSVLKPEGMKALHENIELMKSNPKTNVRVAGYTSMSGTPEYNQRLSERRASAVRDYMVSEGVKQKRITMIGYGETRPKTHESTPRDTDSKAAKSNMRVLFEMSVKP